MAAPWSIQTSAGISAANLLTVSNALTTGVTQNTAIRLRAYSVSLAASSATGQSGTFVVRDGISGGGTILETVILTAPAVVTIADKDLRAVSGTLTCEFTTSLSTATQAISAQGDYVPIGRNYGETP